MNKPLIAIKVMFANDKLELLRSRKIKRIYHFIQRTKNADCKYELYVTYPTNTSNAGTYSSIKNLIHALKAFTEKD